MLARRPAEGARVTIPRVADDPPLIEVLHLQAASCTRLGSPIYATLCDALAGDADAGGLTLDLLGDRPRPQRDAVVLRLLGALHRVALGGRAPALAAQFPSCGGEPDGSLVGVFLAALDEHRDEVGAGLDTQVQTNEVSRAAALVIGFTALARRHHLPLRTREIGASAGLLSRWERYFFDAGASPVGDPDSLVRFTDNWAAPPELSGEPEVLDRQACDLAPLSASSPADRLRLLSFVWPDQRDRFARLDAALRIAAGEPLTIEQASAGKWASDHVVPSPGSTTVLFHSIVWQYLPGAEQDALRAHLRAAGATATSRAPLAWLRMEPAGTHADLRLTTWPGGTEELLATTGYHGNGIIPLIR
jgi:hypothetical protein